MSTWDSSLDANTVQLLESHGVTPQDLPKMTNTGIRELEGIGPTRYKRIRKAYPFRGVQDVGTVPAQGSVNGNGELKTGGVPGNRGNSEAVAPPPAQIRKRSLIYYASRLEELNSKLDRPDVTVGEFLSVMEHFARYGLGPLKAGLSTDQVETLLTRLAELTLRFLYRELPKEFDVDTFAKALFQEWRKVAQEVAG